MMETDDKLIREFFTGQKQEIEDKGFSRKVMRNLPCQVSKWAKVWSVFVTLVAVLLFFAFDGLQAIVNTLRDIIVSMVQSGTASFDPKSLLIAVVVLLFLGVRKAWSME